MAKNATQFDKIRLAHEMHQQQQMFI